MASQSVYRPRTAHESVPASHYGGYGHVPRAFDGMEKVDWTDFNKFWFKSEGFVTNGVASDGDQGFLYPGPIPHLRYLDWQGAHVDIDSGPRRA